MNETVGQSLDFPLYRYPFSMNSRDAQKAWHMNYQKRHQEAWTLHVAKARKSSIYRPRDTEIVGWVYELREGGAMYGA